ncbi:transposable element Tcb2 transposase [Trichonephila clavipes]|nr:transposable element Tcb2 transposase [Trichonephila clavipes]
MLTVPVSTASAERSFSKLKLIKTYLRSTMSQVRLSALSVLSIEAEIVASVSYDIILKKFIATGIRISRQTVYWRLNHAGLYVRRPSVCIPLTSAHKRARLNWSLKHQHWSVGEWVNVMFSDESRFSLSSDSRWVTIWRERETRFEPRNIKERHHFPSRGVMVWAGILMDGRTDLHFFDTESVTDQRYRDEVLEPYVRLFRGAVDPDFIFMDDNAPCYRAVLINDFLETENIQRMSWPANSPDLNPIEHVGDMLGRQIAALSHPPSSVTELKRALQEA